MRGTLVGALLTGVVFVAGAPFPSFAQPVSEVSRLAALPEELREAVRVLILPPAERRATEAMARIGAAAEAGNPVAQVLAARGLAAGDGVAVDGAGARVLLDSALASDDPLALLLAGRLLAAGVPGALPADGAAAAQAIGRAAGGGYPFAQLDAGRVAEEQWHEAVRSGDAETARALLGEAAARYRVAADAGSGTAALAMALLLRERGAEDSAAPWFARAVAAGVPGARVVGLLPRLTSADPDVVRQAVSALADAAAGGDGVAASTLAGLSARGREDLIAADPERAARWRLWLADAGEPSALTAVAVATLAAAGREEDTEARAVAEAAARSLLIRAAEAGYGPAMGLLSRLLDAGTGGPKDVAAAQRWRRLATLPDLGLPALVAEGAL